LSACDASAGDNNHTEWEPLFALYNLPPFIPGSAKTALSWGLAGPRSGVPFHVHGAGYSEPVHGRKRWFLLPPNVRPPFDPNETTLTWVNKNLERTSKLRGFLQCTVRIGQCRNEGCTLLAGAYLRCIRTVILSASQSLHLSLGLPLHHDDLHFSLNQGVPKVCCLLYVPTNIHICDCRFILGRPSTFLQTGGMPL
jgi:hypothetical protein